jgi:hypothetical protein
MTKDTNEEYKLPADLQAQPTAESTARFKKYGMGIVGCKARGPSGVRCILDSIHKEIGLPCAYRDERGTLVSFRLGTA